MPMPFSGNVFTFPTPDGGEIQLRGWGNQFYAVFETLDGFTVIEDPETGYYDYARLSDDKSQLVSTGIVVGDADPQTIGVPSGIRIRRSSAKVQARTARAAEGPPRRWEVRRAQRVAARTALARVAGPIAAAPPPAATVGNYAGLCLLIEFPDVAATIPQEEVNRYCNQVGYSGFGNNGSVRDYFHEVSGQKLTYTNTVTAYYTAAHNRSYYTDPTIQYGSRARELIREALNSLVTAGFDFSGLSSDSGGYVYALNVFYVGPTVNAWAKGLWPHSSGLGTPYVAGSKKFYDYQFTNMGAELTLATFCHENGHMICDFPDLYDYGYESKGAGRFCLMANSGNGKNPIHVGAYLKNAAGWANSVTTLSPGITATVAAGQNEFLIHERSSTEYFILENRRQAGRDASLPDSGLAIWHIDELGSNNNEQMTASQHYECALEQADGNLDLENGANSGDASDLFGSPSDTTFNQTTTPNSQWWDGTASGLLIASISAPGPTMTVVVAGGATAAATDDPGARLLLLG